MKFNYHPRNSICISYNFIQETILRALNVNFKEQRHFVLCKKIRTRQGRDLEGASSVWWGRGRKAGVMTAAGCLDLSVLPGMGDLVVFSAGLECIFGGVWSWEQASSRVLVEHIGV